MLPDKMIHFTLLLKIRPGFHDCWGRITSCTHFVLLLGPVALPPPPRCTTTTLVCPSFTPPAPIVFRPAFQQLLCSAPPPPPRWLPPNFMHHLTLTATERRHSCATYSDGSLLLHHPPLPKTGSVIIEVPTMQMAAIADLAH